mmetsp:Transcript_82609/g.266418  ORF Transcript_82609/g.266418 Transcript_82609/m.266418 type:complete len:597 (-) Transcript_82609:70-1860(-)
MPCYVPVLTCFRPRFRAMAASWRASASARIAGRRDHWHQGGGAWSSSSGTDNASGVFVPESAAAVLEQMASRIGRAFRLANKDLYRMECSLYDDVIAEVAALLQQLGRRLRPHLGKSPETDQLLDLLALLALPGPVPEVQGDLVRLPFLAQQGAGAFAEPKEFASGGVEPEETETEQEAENALSVQVAHMPFGDYAVPRPGQTVESKGFVREFLESGIVEEGSGWGKVPAFPFDKLDKLEVSATAERLVLVHEADLQPGEDAAVKELVGNFAVDYSAGEWQEWHEQRLSQEAAAAVEGAVAPMEEAASGGVSAAESPEVDAQFAIVDVSVDGYTMEEWQAWQEQRLNSRRSSDGGGRIEEAAAEEATAEEPYWQKDAAAMALSAEAAAEQAFADALAVAAAEEATDEAEEATVVAPKHSWHEQRLIWRRSSDGGGRSEEAAAVAVAEAPAGTIEAAAMARLAEAAAERASADAQAAAAVLEEATAEAEVSAAVAPSFEAAAVEAAAGALLPQVAAVKLEEVADLEQEDGVWWQAVCLAAQAMSDENKGRFVEKMFELMSPEDQQRLLLESRAEEEAASAASCNRSRSRRSRSISRR